MTHFQKFINEKIVGFPERIKERYQLWKYIYPFVRKHQTVQPKKIICLFCQPRSGSTWLAEILLSISNTCLFDEPLWRGRFKNIHSMPNFYDRKVPRVAELGFYHIQPIGENEEWQEASELFETLLAGKIVSLGLYNEINLKRLKTAECFIIKFNFAQLLMHWFIKQYDHPSLLLTRHPCAVVNSQINLKAYNNFLFDPTGKKFPDFRNSDFFNQHRIVERLKSVEEQLAFLWAIQIKNSLYHKDNNKNWLTISYEKLLIDFEGEIDRIFDFIGETIPDEVYKNRRRPSKSSKNKSRENIVNGSQLDSWKRALSKQQISKILNIVESMEVDIYSEKLEPDYDKLYRSY